MRIDHVQRQRSKERYSESSILPKVTTTLGISKLDIADFLADVKDINENLL